MNTTTQQVRFQQHAIIVDGKRYGVRYQHGALRSYPEGTITAYAKEYGYIPRIDGVVNENNSDGMVDYFEKTTLRITPDSIYYNDAVQACTKANAKREARWQQYLAKAELAHI